MIFPKTRHWVTACFVVAVWCGAPLLADRPSDLTQTDATQSAFMSSYKHAVYENQAGEKLNYRLHIPTSGKPDTSKASDDLKTKLPLVLFLHGAGERGDDNEAQLKHGALEFLRNGRDERFPAIVVVPQCPKEKRWVETDWGKAVGNGTFPQPPSETMKLVFELLDELIERTDVDPSRLYVTGLSMGGYGSWYAAAEYFPGVSKQWSTERSGTSETTASDSTGGFAAMLAICGGADPGWADRYASTDLWAVHGDADPAVPVTRSREMVAAIATQGHPGELRYTELSGIQHDSWTATYADEDTYLWLFDQIR